MFSDCLREKVGFGCSFVFPLVKTEFIVSVDSVTEHIVRSGTLIVWQ